MNILFLTNELNYTCGVTAHLQNLASGLTKTEKVNVSIISGGGNGINLFKDTDADITMEKTFLHKNRGYVDFAKATYKLVSFVKKNKIDLVHSHTHYAANLAYEASKFCKIKTVQTNHGLLETQGRLPHFKAEKIIAINEHIYEHIIKENITDKENVTLIRCGIHFPPAPVWKAKTRLKVLAASRFVKEKGLDVFIKAISMLPESYRINAEFMIAGEGELEKELKKLNNDLRANVKFLGRITDMPFLLRDTHIFVFPSASRTEGFPSVITEAASYSNLIISSRFTGIEHTLISDIDGLIFKEGDAYDLMIKLKVALDNYETFKPMAKHFYWKVKGLYDISTMVQKHLELYNECLRNR